VAEERDPIELAARALRHRDRSRRQVAERLRDAGIEEDRRHEALETLERLGYLDDERFAAGRAAALGERGYGDAAIRQFLRADGVEEETAEAAIASLEPERDRAQRIIARLGTSTRTAGRLARKGFGEESVAEAAGGGFAVDGSEA
jgi:regulatory protein